MESSVTWRHGKPRSSISPVKQETFYISLSRAPTWSLDSIRKMDFFQSIPVPGRLCSSLCTRRAKSFLVRGYVAIMFIIYLLMIDFYIKYDYGARVTAIRVVADIIPQTISFLLIIESVIQRDSMKRFLLGIKQIDLLLKFTIGIRLKRRTEKRRMQKRFIVWNILMLILCMVLVVFLCKWYINHRKLSCEWDKFWNYFWIFEYIFLTHFYSSFHKAIRLIIIIIVRISFPLIIIQLYFYRLVTFIDMLNHRYRMINCYLRSFNPHENMSGYFSRCPSVYELYNLQRANRLLQSSANSITDLFERSLFVCFFYIFICFTLLGYIFMAINDQTFPAFMISIYLVPGILQVFTLADICQQTSDEVGISFR